MFGQCKGPIWHRDDLSVCFEADFLETILPVSACGLSLLWILTQWIAYKYTKRRRHRQEPLLINIEGEQEDADSDDVDSLSELTLQKTVSRATHLDVNKPTGELYLIIIELVALLGQVTINVYTLATRTGYPVRDRERTSTVGICVWAYVSILAASRLVLASTNQRLPFTSLWNHTAIIYCFQWVLQTWIFRSVLIEPTDEAQKITTILSFALTSLLTIIALVSRKGNRAVLLEHDDDIEPSPEPLASLLSLATFSWVDGVVWRGYNKTLELHDVWNVTLEDKAEAVLGQFRQIKKAHMLAVRLLLFFKRPVLIQGAWCMIASVFMFLPTLLLKAILEYLEDPGSSSPNAAWLYVILLFVTGAVQAVGDGQGLWIGRRICIQIRAIIIGEIYSKTLRRKAAAATEKDSSQTEPAINKQTWREYISSLWRRPREKSKTDSDPSLSKPEFQVNNGTIINLMSIDSFKVADICSYLHFLWAATPVQFIMAIGLLYRVLGYSAFVGIILMICVLPLNVYIAKSFTSAQEKIMAATDARLHSTNEVLQNIRIIKYFAWEERFFSSVDEKRKVEISALWRKYILWAVAATVWSGVPIVNTFLSFLTYTVIEKKPLVPSIAFPALSMFSLLRIPLDQLADMVARVQESKVSLDRVEEFLNEDETEKYIQIRESKRNSLMETRIALENATLSWSSNAGEDDPSNPSTFRLIDMNVGFKIGQLNVIVGPTGSGKTSLLMALLGEMKLLTGHVHIPGGYSRQELRPDPRTGLTESVAYCAQQAWLVNATIKENILFASRFDANRYHTVIRVCALERDLEILDAGDQTLVGEKGITLSGGQKQRISLARAIYSNSKHLLLDDCLSAVDAHTAKHIFTLALTGDLMNNRTCILVSHNIALTVPLAHFVVALENGKIVAQGTPQSVIESGVLGEDVLKSRPVSRMTSAVPSRSGSPMQESFPMSNKTNGHMKGSTDAAESEDPAASKASKTQEFIDPRIERKATGSVKMETIKSYLQAMGPWYYWIFAGFGFIATQLGSVATNLWIRQWANAYHTSGVNVKHGLTAAFHQHSLYTTGTDIGTLSMQMPQTSASQTLMQSISSYDVDVGYYLGIYALLGAVYIVICLGRELILFWGSLCASVKFHERLLHNILRAKFRFFDSTPLGQLTNRFSKDIQAIDQEVAPVAIGMLHSAASVITIVILISAITPGFLIPGVFITLLYVATGLFYIKSSRDLKRIEAVQRSPLFQHFGETLSGVVTIRAYGDESRFIQDSNLRVNTHNRPFIFLWATNRWLAFRIDFAGALVAFFSGMFVVINAKNIDPGAAGLALSYAITFTQNVLWLVRLYAANEQNMNAVERVQEYIDVDQEAPAQIAETKPPANWPSHGAVQFIAYSTRYRPDLEPVLRNVSFSIESGEKVGIVGRTGAGKSSLALALFRGLEGENGKIIIDNVDIGLIGLQDLREAITIVPQDPTLFTGTLRSNLDPFGLFTDEEIFEALRRVQLLPSGHDKSYGSRPTTPAIVSKPPTLNGTTTPRVNGDLLTPEVTGSEATLVRFISNTRDNQNIFRNLLSPVAESGSNLSQGQRQLLCLARALLKSPKVLVMDEATASIDYATDANIQNTLREIKDNTVITIAHRLQTIIDYDKVLVLDKGEVIEYAHPWELISKETGQFKDMCETSGDYEILFEQAKRAWQDKRLIDDS